MPRALITGITGQDGRHLAELLIGKGYEVVGMVQASALGGPGGSVDDAATASLRAEFANVELLGGDLADQASLTSVVERAEPDEVYNFAAMSFVGESFEKAELTADITGLGVVRMLEAVRRVGGVANNPIRFCQASSSEMFGEADGGMQNESTPLHPRSPYGCAKLFGHAIVANYRDAYGMHASSAILFNHEGPRRGIQFVTRKVTNAVARIKLGVQDELVLGNLDSKRDWGYAGDYVRGMWLMLQQDHGDDYVLATGRTHSIRDFVGFAFAAVGIDDWEQYVRQDPAFYRPADIDVLVGDASKARTELGWEPDVDLKALVTMMVEHDLALESSNV